jgi:hypothetical protein
MKSGFVVLGVLIALAGCGGDDDDDSGSGSGGSGNGSGGSGDGSGGAGEAQCPDLSGTFLITSHCEETFVGDTSESTQTGCEYTSTSGDYTCTGTIGSDGAITQVCPGIGADGGDMNCTGSTDGDRIELDCDGCTVVTERQ